MAEIILNKQQKKAVETDSKKALLIAGAGSGKTRVLTERIAYLIEKKNVSPYEITAFTFTRLAAKEMKDRLEKRIGSAAFKITIGTQHAVALNFIQRFGDLIGLRPEKITVYNQWESDYLLKDTAIQLGYHSGYAWTGVKKKTLDKVIMMIAENEEFAFHENVEFSKELEIIKAFQARCRENNALTYDSILSTFLILLPEIKQYLGFKHVFLDESQDNSKIQWDITNLICELSGAVLFVVGDPSQCQPAGTMVMTTKGEKDIKDIVPGIDELKVYCRPDSMVYGGHNRGYSFKKSARIFTGNLFEIKSGNKKTQCTGNHKWLVKWNNNKRLKKWNVVYLMKRNDRFRIGWCQLFKGEKKGHNTFHLGQRMRIEKADSVWILRIFDNKKEASLWESILAANYGIPTIMFEPKETTYYYDQAGIDLVFNFVSNLNNKALKLLNDLCLDILYPFHSKERHQKKGGIRIFEIETMNMAVMPQHFFRIPRPKKNSRYIEWKSAEINTKTVRNITVYSLDVEKYHTYIANGLCTKNSIYQFRGADPEYLIRNQSKFDIFKLQNNYRSDANIVNAANKLIKHNKKRLDLDMIPVKPGLDASINIIDRVDSLKIKQLIGFLCKIAPKESMTVLSRNHYLLQKLSSLLDQDNITHDYIGKKTKLAHSEDFRRFHAFLKLIINPFCNFSFLLIKQYLGISNEDYSNIRVMASEQGKSHFQIWCKYPDSDYDNYDDSWLKWFKASERGDIDTIIDWMKEIDFNFDTDPIFDFVYTWRLENLDKNLDDYLNWLSTYDIQDEISKTPANLQLMTVHAAKGLEFSTVIIAGLNEGIFPDKREIKIDSNVENERNLAYVAMTRAENQLVLTSRPLKKDLFEIKNPVSRFVGEAL